MKWLELRKELEPLAIKNLSEYGNAEWNVFRHKGTTYVAKKEKNELRINPITKWDIDCIINDMDWSLKKIGITKLDDIFELVSNYDLYLNDDDCYLDDDYLD